MKFMNNISNTPLNFKARVVAEWGPQIQVQEFGPEQKPVPDTVVSLLTICVCLSESWVVRFTSIKYACFKLSIDRDIY